MSGHVLSKKAYKTLHLKESKKRESNQDTKDAEEKKREQLVYNKYRGKKEREQERETKRYEDFLIKNIENCRIKGVNGFF